MANAQDEFRPLSWTEDDFEEFDPLAVDDDEIDQEWMDDLNPHDTIDFPTMRNMPEVPGRPPVYSPARQGSAGRALRVLVERNPNRRGVLLGIMDLCRDGCASSVITKKVNEWQRDNWSVYAPMTLCRMLETAGVLKLEEPEISQEHTDVEEGVTYLEIDRKVDPIWRATDEGIAELEALTNGDEFRALVLGEDVRYAEVYLAVMQYLNGQGHTHKEIAELVDTFPIVMKPRRFGAHFIDVLDRTGPIVWADHAWHLSEAGRALLPEITQAAVRVAAGDEVDSPKEA